MGAMTAVGSPNRRGFGLFCVTLQRLLFLLLCLLGTLANKLNVPQVLLPFGQEPGRVPFLLEAQRGCYTWWGVAGSQEYAPPRCPGRMGRVHWTEDDATGILWSFILKSLACRDQGWGVSRNGGPALLMAYPRCVGCFQPMCGSFYEQLMCEIGFLVVCVGWEG